MKPLHSNFTMVGLRNRCACCATKWAKRINGTAKHGNSAARQQYKKDVKQGLRDV